MKTEAWKITRNKRNAIASRIMEVVCQKLAISLYITETVL